MNRDKFMKDLNRDLLGVKKAKSKSEEIIKDLSNVKGQIMAELDREKGTKHGYDASFEDIWELAKFDSEEGPYLDFDEFDEEGYDVFESLCHEDPLFALSFIEKRKSMMPEDKYESIKEGLLKRVEIK